MPLEESASAPVGTEAEPASDTLPTGDPAAAEPDDTLVGQAIDQIELQIDYAIVRHFSEHLYGSPNKAVEELVANSFDAMAQNVYVYVPGRFSDRLVVWDDGESMERTDARPTR